MGGGTHYQIVAVNVDGKDITEAVENGGGNPGGGDNPGGETPDEGKFASNVKWTFSGKNAYDGACPDNTRQTATINGVKGGDHPQTWNIEKTGKGHIDNPCEHLQVVLLCGCVERCTRQPHFWSLLLLEPKSERRRWQVMSVLREIQSIQSRFLYSPIITLCPCRLRLQNQILRSPLRKNVRVILFGK